MRRPSWLTAAGLAGIASLATGLALAGGPGAITTAGAGAGCGTGMLTGVYAMAGAGNTGGAPFATTGTATFDGAGRFSGSHLESIGGTIERASMEGTYRIGDGCRGTAVFVHRHERPVRGRWVEYLSDTHVLDLVVSAGGQRVGWLVLGNTTATPANAEHTPEEANVPVPGIVISGTFERS